MALYLIQDIDYHKLAISNPQQFYKRHQIRLSVSNGKRWFVVTKKKVP
jgi:hypothetical protein